MHRTRNRPSPPIEVLAAVALFVCGCTMSDASMTFGANDVGLGLGNARSLNGLRINLRDVAMKKMNGLNFSALPPGPNPEAVVNGLNVGLLGTNAKEQNGLNLSTLLDGGELFGINVGVLRAAAEERLRGLNLSAFGLDAKNEMSGLSLASWLHGQGTIGGIAIGLLGIQAEKAPAKGTNTDSAPTPAAEATGLLLSGLFTQAPALDGVSVTGYAKCERLSGVSASYLMNDASESMAGVAIAPVNRTKKLCGLQFGLVNIVESRTGFWRTLPLIQIGFDTIEEPAASQPATDATPGS